MKKQNLILLGVVAVAGFFAWKKGLFGKKTETPETPETESETETPETDTGTGTKPTIIDVSKGNVSIPQAIEQAKQIVENIRDVKVVIKTPPGQKNISVKRKEKQQAKKTKRKEKKESRKAKRQSKKSK